MKKTVISLAFCTLFTSIAFSQSTSGLSIQAGGYFPMDNFGDVYETGLGGRAGIFFSLSKHFQLGITSGYTKFNFNTDELNKVLSGQENRDISIKIDAPLHIVPIMLSARYVFESSRLKPYFIGELGAHYVSMDLPTFTVGARIYDPDETASEIAVGFGAGLGFLLKLDRNLYFDINGKFNGNTLTITEFVASDSGGRFVERNITWISLNAGIYIPF